MAERVRVARRVTTETPQPLARRRTRRTLFVAFVVVQLAFVVRAYWAPHHEFGYQMFPEASEWQAEIVRVTTSGDRIPIEQSWSGYTWNELVPGRGLSTPWRRHHADAGLDNQLAFLEEAIQWVAENTPADTETRRLEATVTTWFNLGDPATVMIRSGDRDLP